MGSISDALKRAELERQRMRGAPQGVEPPPADAAPPSPAAPTRETPGLASVVFRQRGAASKPAEVPAQPLTTAVRSSAATVPPAVRKQQEHAETIVEDYAAKQRLALPHTVVVYHDRSGPIAEQFRKIRQRLMEQNLRHEPTMLVLTSTHAGEGKTVTALNLGLSLVEVRSQRVLLLDGDLHHAGLSKLLKMHGQTGFSELVTAGADPASIEAAVRPSPWHNLYVMPAGATCAPVASAELLKLPSARATLRHLRNMFDWVLVDSPAALAFPDAGVLGAASDGIVLVSSLKTTHREPVQKMVRRLASMNLPVRGCILTRHDG